MPYSFEWIAPNNAVIRCDYYACRNQDSLGTLLISHGFKGFKDWGMFPYVAERISERLDVVTFNFSHNGVGEQLTEFTELEKFAVNTYSREIADVQSVVEGIRNGTIRKEAGLPLEEHDPELEKPLFLLGHSRGAAVSFIYALDHPEKVAGVIGWNGSLNVDIFSEEEKEQMRRDGRAYAFNARTKQQMPLDRIILEDMEQHQERFDIVGRIDSLAVPAVLIQGSEDFPRLKRITVQAIERNQEIAHIVVPEGNHTFNAVHPFQGTTEPLELAIESTLEWIKSVCGRDYMNH